MKRVLTGMLSKHAQPRVVLSQFILQKSTTVLYYVYGKVVCNLGQAGI